MDVVGNSQHVHVRGHLHLNYDNFIDKAISITVPKIIIMIKMQNVVFWREFLIRGIGDSSSMSNDNRARK